MVWCKVSYPSALHNMQWCSWLSYHATSQKDGDMIHDGVTVGHALALGLTQPLTEMSTRDVSWR
jgi:hypothetical protein